MRNKPFQCKRDKMFTMSAFDPALIILANIYADQFDTRPETRVYCNGIMQVSIFISVNYNGDTDEGILDEIKGYVQDNVVIYTLDDGKVELDTSKWIKSTEDNGYHHDIDRASNDNTKSVSDIRVPLYFTVPAASEGEHNWIASLDGMETSTSTPLTVNVERLHATKDSVEIADKAATECHQMHVLKYKDGAFPDVLKLVKLVDYKGIKFLSSADKAWVSMIHSSKGHKMGVFLQYKETKDIRVAKPEHLYWSGEMIKKDIGATGDQNLLHCSCCDDSLHDFTSDQFEQAWNEGIVMLMVHDSSLEMVKFYDSLAVSTHYNNFETNDFLIEDNFGNRMICRIDWNLGSGWWGNWEVSVLTVVYP